ncbi:MAG TPA: hypothetical protein VIJ94_19140 [Caulobacteraceae bacterium]
MDRRDLIHLHLGQFDLAIIDYDAANPVTFMAYVGSSKTRAAKPVKTAPNAAIAAASIGNMRRVLRSPGLHHQPQLPPIRFELSSPSNPWRPQVKKNPAAGEGLHCRHAWLAATG